MEPERLSARNDTTGGVLRGVEPAKILQSRHPLLNQAAKEALMQWQYSPLILNGVATPFVLTVTFNFGFQK